MNGLQYIPAFIDDRQSAWLMEQIEAGPWNHSIRRRTQHYGFEYNYASRNAARNLGPLPEWLNQVIRWACDKHPVFPLAQQVIVNEYVRGQGIAMHTDRTDQFGSVIASISLLSPVVMSFQRYEERPTTQLLEPKSLLMLSGEARYQWRHGFPAGAVKDRRISLTFRTMI